MEHLENTQMELFKLLYWDVKWDWIICYNIMNYINDINVLIALALFGVIRVN